MLVLVLGGPGADGVSGLFELYQEGVMPERTSRTVYVVVAALAVVALLLGLWDVVVERDGGGLLWGVAFPVLLLVLALVMMRKDPDGNDRATE